MLHKYWDYASGPLLARCTLTRIDDSADDHWPENLGGEQRIHDARGLDMQRRNVVAKGFEREVHVRASQRFTHHLDMHTLGQQQSGRGVAHVVETDRPIAGGGHGLLEDLVLLARIVRGAVLSGKDQILILPERPDLHPL